MSYCRWGEAGSDVYVYDTGAGIVCACDLDLPPLSRAAMRDHLIDHRRHGEHVPAFALERLTFEIENGDRSVYEILKSPSSSG